MTQWLSALLRTWLGFSPTVGRTMYVTTGLFLAAVKYVGDSYLMHRSGLSLGPLDYLTPVLGERISGADDPSRLSLSLLAWALPFIWVGASMTIRRSLDAGLSGRLGLLFFLPIGNYIYMATLCLLPTANRSRRLPDGPDQVGLNPGEFNLARAVFGGFATGTLIFLVCHFVGAAYGFGLFVGGPFATGFVTASLYSQGRAKSLRATLLAVQLPIVFIAGALLLFAIEGVICLAMAAPLGMALSALGGLAGRTIVSIGSRPLPSAMVVLAITPSLAGLEPSWMPPLRSVETTIEIAAPPEAVWNEVVSFSELPPPSQLLFKTGIAYPLRAEIHGTGVGAIRHCIFSTGSFVEPITVWDEPYRLGFDVIEQPPTMEEWSPYKKIEPAHLTESLRSERGQFLLERLPGNRTRLTGTTWYRSYLFPQIYWGGWTDLIIHSIHERVLEHIQREVETAVTSQKEATA